MKFFSLYTFFIFCLLTTKIIGQKNSEGVIGFGQRIFNNETGQFVIPTYYKDYIKIWYKDSTVIEESEAVYSTKDITGKESICIEVDHYSYIDLRTKSFYDYPAFSADLMFNKKYTLPDSVTGKVWNFYTYHKIWPPETISFLPDTIINSVLNKRIKSTVIDSTGSLEEIDIGYIRCDKKNSIFHIDRGLDEKIGCPVTKIEFINPKTKRDYYAEIVFLADKLTPEELMVFDAWEKNAKQNPVK